ncbi:hypothetical protein ON010_g12242 [Phytophthora cinnamomi]|nr:hypothetical protein ON010_g12242 [Phytophthora cinnamomi]
MRLQIVLLTIVGLIVTWNSVSVASEANIDSSDSATSAGLLHAGIKGYHDTRGLRESKVVDKGVESPDSEERGFADAIEKARVAGLKALIPAWYAAGKTPLQVAKDLGITGAYPMLTHKNWKVAKSFKKFYDKHHKNYP